MNLTRQPDSKGVLICPACYQRRYVGPDFFAYITALEAHTGPDFRMETALPAHDRCNGHMTLTIFPPDMPEPLTRGDLGRVFFRAQDDEGRWKSVSAEEATDAQFNAWVKTRFDYIGVVAWSLVERADFCDLLQQRGGIVLLKKESDPGQQPEEEEQVL